MPTVPIRLTKRPRYDVEGVYSPAGDRIAFSSNADGNFEIYLMNRDGDGMVRITRDAADDKNPRWSPDGRSIVFESNRNGEFSIYRVDL